MKVAVVNTYSDGGGAALAARRLHQSLLTSGCQSTFVVRAPSANFPATRIVPHKRRTWKSKIPLGRIALQEKLLLRSFQPTGTYWSSNLTSNASCSDLNSIDADVVNLHWIGDDFISIDELAAVHRPIVWSLHDQWAFTGGCHYSGACERFTSTCGNCPHLVGRKWSPFQRDTDLSQYIHERKRQLWNRLDITVVCASEWMAATARKSSLFRDRRVEIIRYPLNLKVFRPLDKIYARDCFGLPKDKKLILFAAIGATSDPRKGFQELRQALPRVYAALGDKVAAVVLGAWDVPDIGIPVFPVGNTRDEIALPLIYSACDVNVTPSRQDNYPNIIYEAAACGTPTAAFAVGGISDAIRDTETGLLAPGGDIDALTQAIIRILVKDQGGASAMSRACVEFALSHHDSEKQAKRYMSLFESLGG